MLNLRRQVTHLVLVTTFVELALHILIFGSTVNDVALTMVAVGGGQQAPPIDIAPGLKKIAEDLKAKRNPTVETPTDIEGNWLGACHNVSTSVNGKIARSFNVGFIFRGNSFYRQLDYYPEANCRYSSGTLAENRVAAEIASGWFALSDGPNGLRCIDLLAAPNFGNVYILNVYEIKRSKSGDVLLMGDAGLNNKERPTKATQEYQPWKPGTNYK